MFQNSVFGSLPFFIFTNFSVILSGFKTLNTICILMALNLYLYARLQICTYDCLSYISTWLLNGNLKLNTFKIEFLVFPLKLSVCCFAHLSRWKPHPWSLSAPKLWNPPWLLSFLPPKFSMSGNPVSSVFKILSGSGHFLPLHNLSPSHEDTCLRLLQPSLNWAASILPSYNIPVMPYSTQSQSPYNVLSFTWSAGTPWHADLLPYYCPLHLFHSSPTDSISVHWIC